MGQTHYPSKKSLRASSLSKLDNMVNSNSIFMRRCAKFSTKWFEILNFNKPTCIYKHPYNLHQKSIPSFQPIFTSLFSLTCSENNPYNPHYHSLFQYLGNFSSFFSLAQASLESLHKAYFQRTDSVLISAFFLKYGQKNKVHNHFFYIAQAQTIGVLHVVVSPPSLSLPIPLSYCHYFPTLLIP